MKPLIVLLATFLLALVITKLVTGEFELTFPARTALSVMLVFTAIAHFAFTQGMTRMLPEFVPFRTEIVYLTGILELVAAGALFVPALRVVTGWLLIAFFLLLLPANIYAAAKHIDYQTGATDGNGLSYLWFRVPLQALFIAWTYFSCLRIPA